MFSERDAEFTASIIQTNPVGTTGTSCMRVLGSSLTRVAEAAVAVYVQTLEPQMDAPSRSARWWRPRMADVTAAALASAIRWAPSSPTTCGTPSTANG